MRIRGSGPGQPLRNRRVDDVQRAVVTRIVQVVVDRNWRRGRTLSVVMRLHLRKCGKTWRKVDSRWKRRRGGHSRVARAVVGDRDAHAALELVVVQLADALTKTRGLLLGDAPTKAHALQLADALTKARNH